MEPGDLTYACDITYLSELIPPSCFRKAKQGGLIRGGEIWIIY